MSGMGGSPFGSAHQDVLGQTPTDPESKQRLVDEIKDRARKAFARRDMPVCEALYSKALKVLPGAALYSNRSAVRLALGRFDDAFEDATKATETDSYAKGYYRLGQAGEKCGKFEAQKAYEMGKELEPESKVWPSRPYSSWRRPNKPTRRSRRRRPRRRRISSRRARRSRSQKKARRTRGRAVPCPRRNHAARRRRGGGVDLPRRDVYETLRWRLDWRRARHRRDGDRT